MHWIGVEPCNFLLLYISVIYNVYGYFLCCVIPLLHGCSMLYPVVDCVWNVMAHMQKPDFVFWRYGWVHLNRRGRQFSRLLAAEMCAISGSNVQRLCEGYWIPTPFTSFPFTTPPVCHSVQSRFKRSLHMLVLFAALFLIVCVV